MICPPSSDQARRFDLVSDSSASAAAQSTVNEEAPRSVPELTLHVSEEPSPAERPTLSAQALARLSIARERIHAAALAGQRIRTYEIALDIDMSEFHFARQFRLAFDRSPHVYYDEVRAETARGLLVNGLSEGTVARRIGFRRPAELRALLAKRPAGTLPESLI